MKQKLRQSTLSLALAASIVGAFTWSADSHACAAEPLVGSVCFTASNFCPNGFLPATGQTVNIQNYQVLYALLGTRFGGNGSSTFGLPDLRGRAPIGANDWGIVTGGVAISAVPLAALRGQETVTLAASQVPLPQHSHPAAFTGTGSGTPAQASGNVSVPVKVTVPSQNISVSGSVKIANSTATGVQAVSPNAVLAKGGAPAMIYATSATAADTNIGPTQTFTGSTTASTVNTTAAGPVTLPVTGGGGITGGTVTVGAAGAPAATPVSLISPQQALTACIAWNGIFPERP